MSRITKNISRHEITCRCGCGYDTIDFAVIVAVQKYADYLSEKYKSKATIDFSSGRGASCIEHNEKVQKIANPDYKPYSSKSKHLIAKAVDVKFFIYIRKKKTQIPPREVYDYFDEKYPNSFGVGKYDTFNHIDSRDKKARWDKTTS